MRKALLTILTAAALTMVAGCGGGAGTEMPAAVTANAPALPFCTYDTTLPTNASGSLSYDSRPPHTDCVPPAGGEVFSLGFAASGWWLQLDAVRSQFTIGEPVRLEATDQVSLLALDCWNWKGDVIVTGDLPSWSVFIDATCADDASVRIVGQWSGPAVN